MGGAYQEAFHPIPLQAIRERWQEVWGLRVLLRVDLNVPTGPDHEVLCDYRLRRIVGLVELLARIGCRISIISHFDRPRGRYRPEMSLSPFIGPLSRMLRSEVTFLPDCIGPDVEAAVNSSPPGSVFLLENLRFHRGEEEASPEFAAQLARLGDVFINDAFSVSHRAHASTVLLPQLLPAFAGPAFVHEYARALDLVNLIRPPLVVISGGRKLEKLLIYRQLMPRIDSLLLGSGFAGVFSRHPNLLGSGASVQERIVKPLDLLTKDSDGSLRLIGWEETRPGLPALDIGPRTVELYAEKIRTAGTLLFNGSPGALKSTQAGASHPALLDAFMSSGALKAVFGGTACSLFIRSGLARNVNFIFPGGGALLSFINDQSNPAIPLLAKPGWSALASAAPSRQVLSLEGGQ